jgi:hypothetical protein
MEKRLFLDGRLIARRENVERVIAPCRVHDGPLTLDGERAWKRNNLHLSWYRDEAGEFQGWTNGHPATANEKVKGEMPAWRITSPDGIHWKTVGGAAMGLTVIRDDADPDPARRFKTLMQSAAVLDAQGNAVTPLDDGDALDTAWRAGRKVERGMFVAHSTDGMNWGAGRPVVINTCEAWRPELGPNRNPDGDAKVEHTWWKPGAPGWAGGDNFPCLIYLPDQRKYVAFYRTNIDRRTSLRSTPGRRERAVGRSESADFIHWTPHELALRSNVDWQSALGHGQQDFYQLQVWAAGGVYLGILSVFYWKEDRNRLELAWSPDTVQWERICPYTDFIPHGELGTFGGGCSYAAMRPQEVDGEVRVYFGADKGRHNADPDRESTLLLARFKPDRFAGLRAAAGATGAVTTAPLTLDGARLTLNADASAGEARVELRDETGRPLPGFSLAECDPITQDSLASSVSWRGRSDVTSLARGNVVAHIEFRNTALYAMQIV